MENKENGADRRLDRRFVVDPRKCRELCTCGGPHPEPLVEIVSGGDIYSALAKDCEKFLSGGRLLLVDDENTRRAAGHRVAQSLSERNVRFDEITVPGDSSLSDKLVETVERRIDSHALIVATGSGTVNDLGKSAASVRKIPYWCVPTAPSMNGYTSAIAAVKVAGVKRTLPAPPPKVIYADMEVVRNAPVKLRQSGFCDLLAKSVSDIDWQTESLLFSGSYCELPSALVEGAESIYMGNPEGIGTGDLHAVQGLFDGLLISGVAMSVAGSSAPASGGEHLISHFFDMREALTGKPPELHGLQVAAGIVLSAACYEILSSIDKEDLAIYGEKRFRKDFDRIPEIWGELSDEVKKRFLKKRDQLLAFERALPDRWPTLRAMFETVRKPEFFIDLIRRTGFPMTLESVGMATDEYILAAETARTIRERITVLDVAAHCGVLQDAARRAAELLRPGR